MAGGTGGHVFPALSIAEYLLANGVDVEWLGTRAGLEAKVVEEKKIPIHYISITGIRGKKLSTRMLSPFRISIALMQSIIKMLTIRPNCVLGMGGFVTGPGGMAAWLLGKHLLIHEQNAVAGFTNQLLYPCAKTVMQAFPGAFERKQKLTKNIFLRQFIRGARALTVGNPVRQEIIECGHKKREEKAVHDDLRILVLGGSLGAQAINEVIPRVLAKLEPGNCVSVRHQCGNKNIEQTLAFYADSKLALNERREVVPFINDMAAAYLWADLVICRAGAITISELLAVGVASILLPFPGAVDDHQTANARILEAAGAGILIPQDKLNVTALFTIICDFISNPKKLFDHASSAKSLYKPDATRMVAESCLRGCYA
ncbi:MAG: undecaprenyldiphospho-muramoylpentapeptide beta-N-acetylglucosaminyltransferase [Pseudomonadales bacterium]|nr:undecaprenyldiphospho-muramoylpentapeptide beta-N-acetylglucosaminyltransferase [Pseudomonadales bacterium]